ncbi:SOS response-associated peptidase [Aureivirga sp. CE67]|uniref:SOS response-associated peptidase n=1 Tax=Aureivirga sp. CE67 TaxID=1788983 RepID=UPI0018CB5066|nr:SOS response-associated peptidase family protein [Aureivirga sp. CE67]
MCFHSSQTKKVQELENRFQVKLSEKVNRPYFDVPQFHLNGFAHPNMLLIPQEKNSVLFPGRWGIVPKNIHPDSLDNYYKEAIKFGGGLNAQAEKVFDHFLYKESIYTRRCIIPVTGFFEPHEFEKKKYPVYVFPKDQNCFSLAGIYSIIGKTVTFSILTKEASPLFSKIHNTKKRQPILLSKGNEKMWLDENKSKSEIYEMMHFNYSEENIAYHTVDRNLFNPKIDTNESSFLEKMDYGVF